MCKEVLYMRTYSSSEIVKILKKKGFKISQRTFTYYASEKKILPKPVVYKNRLKYTNEHIEYLKAILILREKGNTLDEIKQSLDELNIEELRIITQTYKPFTSMEMIKEAKEVYKTHQKLNKGNSQLSHENFGLIDNYTFTSQAATDIIADGVANHLNNGRKSGHKGNSMLKRTIVSEDIILETRNIDSKTLSTIIKSIDDILNN